MHPDRPYVQGSHEIRLWICHGWDGDGCSPEVTAGDLDWELVGQVSELNWTLG